MTVMPTTVDYVVRWSNFEEAILGAAVIHLGG